jgi:NAD(P)H-quinone oxidoreductase subunit 5
LAKLTYLFDKQVIDGITNEVGFTSFFTGEGIKYEGDGNISFYLI